MQASRHPVGQRDLFLFLLCCLPFQRSFIAGALGGQRFDDGLTFQDERFQFLAREGLLHPSAYSLC